MPKALYYNENKQAKEFDVIAEDKTAGTVDIGVGKTVVVKGAKVVTEPKIGCVKLVTDAEAEKAAAEKAAAEKAEKKTSAKA